MARLVNDRVRIQVPASSANLGPGFDAVGIALDLRDDIEVRATAGPTRVRVEGHGAAEVPVDDNHLVVRAIRFALDYVGAPQAGLELICRNSIPHGSGLGSSAAAVVAGLVAVRGLSDSGDVLDNPTILRLATELEGHPDNAAPALVGGATIAWLGEEGPAAAQVTVGEHVRPTVLTPPTALLTKRARAVLPSYVTHDDAAFNAARSALLVLALQERGDLLMEATRDRMHQQQRADVMPATLEVVDELRHRGLPAVVSGAGPSVLLLAGHDEGAIDTFVRHGWTVRRPDVCSQGATVEVMAPA